MTNTHPHYLYSDVVNSIKADKAVITAMTGLLDGTIAYATDTNEFGTYDLTSNAWTWLGSGGGTVPHPPEGRLTLVTGTPVMSAEVVSGTTIYYTPYLGDLYPSYGGASWTERMFTEMSLVLDSNSGHSGYHQSGKNFDLFLYNDGGTDRLLSGPAWTSDTARSALLARKNGILTNASSITGRFGNGAGDTVTIPANQGTYVGFARMWSNGACTWQLGGDAAGGDPAHLYLYNFYNKVTVEVRVTDSSDSWTYNSATWRAANNSNNNRVNFITDNIDALFAVYDTIVNPGGVQNAVVGVGLDITNGYSGTAQIAVQSNTAGGDQAHWSGLTGIGFHFLQAVEYQSAGTGTYYGDFGVNWLKTGLFVRGMF